MPALTPSLPFPKPPQGVKEQPENLGEYLTGNRIENSGYKLSFLDNENCKFLDRHQYSKDQIAQWQKSIKEDYHVNWIMDNIPSAAAIDDYDTKTQTVVYDLGFPVGLLLWMRRGFSSGGQQTLRAAVGGDDAAYEAELARYKARFGFFTAKVCLWSRILD